MPGGKALTLGFQVMINKNLAKALIKKYQEGDTAAKREIIKRLGKEAIDLLPPKKEEVARAVTEIIAPISDWNVVMASSLDIEVKEKIDEGFHPKEISNYLKFRMPQLLDNTIVTIQRPGKRQYSMPASKYIDLVSRTVPMYARNAGYISRMKKTDKFKGWRSICPADERSCPECVALMEQSKAKPFSWDDPHPPYHPNCRCRPMGVLTNDEMVPDEEITDDTRENVRKKLLETGNIQVITPGGVKSDEAYQMWKAAGFYPVIDEKAADRLIRERIDKFVIDNNYTFSHRLIPNRALYDELGARRYYKTADVPKRRLPRYIIVKKGEYPGMDGVVDVAYFQKPMHMQYMAPAAIVMADNDQRLFGDGLFGNTGAQKFKELFGLSDDQFKKIEDELRYASLKMMVYSQTGGIFDYDSVKKQVEEKSRVITVNPELVKVFKEVYPVAVMENMKRIARYSTEPLGDNDIIMKVLRGEPAPPSGPVRLHPGKPTVFITDADYSLMSNVLHHETFQEILEKKYGRTFNQEEEEQLTFWFQKEWLNCIEKTDGFRFDPSHPKDYAEQFWYGFCTTYLDPVSAAKNMPEFTKLLINQIQSGVFKDDETIKKVIFTGSPDVDFFRWKGKIAKLEAAQSIVNEFAERMTDREKMLQAFLKHVKEFDPTNPGLGENSFSLEYGKVKGHLGRCPADGSYISVMKEIWDKQPMIARNTFFHELSHFQSIYIPDPATGKPRRRFIDIGYTDPEERGRLLLNNFGVTEYDPALVSKLVQELNDVMAYVRAVIAEDGPTGAGGMLEVLRVTDRISQLPEKEWWKSKVDPETGQHYSNFEEAINKELGELCKRSPTLNQLNDLANIRSAAMLLNNNTYLDIKDAQAYFSKFFPPDYDLEARDDIIAYYLSKWVHNGPNLTRATEDWASKYEEKWATFNECIMYNPTAAKVLAPTAYDLYLKALDRGYYNKVFNEILGYKKDVDMLSLPAINESKIQAFTKMFESKREPQVVEAVNVYRSDKYKDINAFLRGQKTVTAEEQQQILSIVSNIEKAAEVTPVPLKVFRGFAHPDIPDDLNLIKGGVLIDDGIVSTSFDENVAKKYAEEASKEKGVPPVVAEIVVPEGHKVVYTDGILGKEIEKEIVLMPGQKFKIVDAFLENGIKKLLLMII